MPEVLLPTGWVGFGQGTDECSPGPIVIAASPDTGFDCINDVTEVALTISGGTPPYTAGTTGGTLSQVSPTEWTISADPNLGPEIGGTAYQIAANFCAWGGFNDSVCVSYGCNGEVTIPCTGVGCGVCTSPGMKFALTEAPDSCKNQYPVFATACEGLASYHDTCDFRTQDMIDLGCNPCGTSVGGGVIVTVTDSQGNSTAIEIPG